LGLRPDLVELEPLTVREQRRSAVSDRDVATVVAFNEAINARDLDALGRLMHEQHRFIDSAGATVEGKAACIEAWHGFFNAFPDYRNIFDDIRSDATGAIQVRGRSECSTPALDGPARWRALVEDGLVLQWQVSDVSDQDVEP
jgi:ketosteroid isomerase-like protein